MKPKKRTLAGLVVGLVAGLLFSAAAMAQPSPVQPIEPLPDLGPINVIVCAGQSNMVGNGHRTSSGIPPYLQVQEDVLYCVNIYTYQRDWGYLGDVPSGSGGGGWYHASEVTIGRTLADAYPDQKWAIIKVAKNGTHLFNTGNAMKSWNVNAVGNLYDWSSTYIQQQLDKLAAMGYLPEVRGFVWIQGEGDCHPVRGLAYEDNLTDLIAEWRTDFAADAGVFIGMVRPEDEVQYPNVADYQTSVLAVHAADAFTFVLDLDYIPLNVDLTHFQPPEHQTVGWDLGDMMVNSGLFD